MMWNMWKSKSWYLAAAAFICFAPGVFAQNVTMELIAPPAGPYMAGVYISPYVALIGAPGQTKAVITGDPTYVICDDFTTDVSINTPPWQAIGTNVAALQGETTPNNTLKFDHGSGSAAAAVQIFDYTVAAYLAVEIMQAKAAGDVTKEGRLSFSLWGLFDPTVYSPTLGWGPLSGHWVTGSDLTYANQYLTDARNAVLSQGLTPANYSNVTIYSPTPQSASQEYLVVRMAEPSFLALLGIDLLAVVGLILFVRRRFAGAVN
jgi:hypothetical protein